MNSELNRHCRSCPQASFLALILLAGASLIEATIPVAGAAVPRGSVIEDFESGSVDLVGYPDQDLDPEAWTVTSDNTFGDSQYALLLYGNTWKQQVITPVAVSDTTVWQVAVYTDKLGEMHAFGIGDGENELFYTFNGEQLPESSNWWTVYQGAFPRKEWHLYLLPIGADWLVTFGYLPTVTHLIYVNDDDDGPAGDTLFDAIVDVSEDQPIAPRCNILYTIESSEKIAAKLYRIGIQFQGTVFDPDSDSHTFAWDFGDSTTSAEQNPAHSFLVHADYTYTVGLVVHDPEGLAAGDTCQIQVEEGSSELPLTVNFVGDVFTGRGYESPGGIIDTYGVEALFEPTLAIFGQAADLNVANLEVSYTDRGTPHPTKSVVFRSRPENIVGLTFAGIEVVTLGNNHIVDYGEIGMLDTMTGLEEIGIRYCGAGLNEYFALQPTFWTEKGVRMAFLGQCNRTGRTWNYQPFLDAGYGKPGFAYLLPDNLESSIGFSRDLADIVIVQTHSGDEYQTAPPPDRAGGGATAALAYAQHDHQQLPVEVNAIRPGMPDVRFRNEPTPGERELRRLAIDNGADILINHHPHVLQGFESYAGKLIAHSLGNFIFDLYYPETMPTMVLTLEVDKSGIVGTSFTPAWINHWIPRPVSGGLAREIMDRLADYSRPMNALVVPDYTQGTARIHLSRSEVDSTSLAAEATVALREESGYAVSPPIALAGAGNLAAISSVTGDGTGWEVCWGREILWHGAFEAEGADFWSVNTDDEWLDDEVFHGGARSLALRRDDGDDEQTGTDLERHLPCDSQKRHSAAGWLKIDNAAAARIMARFYHNRYNETPLASIELAEPADGSADWQWQWRNLETPENGIYFELRCALDPPASGTGQAWYDDIVLVEWEDWQPASTALEIAAPNNYRYLQLRSSTADATSATVSYRETNYGIVTTAAPATPPQVRSVALRNFPNPFNPRTTIELALPDGPAAVPVEVAIFDLRGRRVSSLFTGLLAAGRRHGFSWDGRDDRGRGLSSGTYFARAVVAGRAHSTKLLLVR